ARLELQKVWDWAFDWTKVGRPAYEGATPMRMLAVPMILLNLIEEVAGDEIAPYMPKIEDCISQMRLHIHEEVQTVFENVSPNGSLVDNPDGRLLNPGHAIEAGWFLQHWAQRLGRPDLQDIAIQMVRWSHDAGWDQEYGGLYYFLDADGYSPTALEWNMKLWWPHCEAMYAHLLNYSLTGEGEDLKRFEETTTYTFNHFPDPEFGEWYGYLDRYGNVTHRFKGGPYKGCFHVPRALWLCWKKLKAMEFPLE
ncbi:MAG TPA: N-acylglucosamine 2-epimerase, partial [Bacteroidetes bacterium]|nr:N-acylglucosamine 2-epimerase [Bacteroidota bacterium]